MPTKTTAAPTAKKITPPAKPAAERPHAGLTQTQEEIADLASDLLLNGGVRQDLDLMLTALLRHEYRRRSFNRGSKSRTPAQVDQDAREYAAGHGRAEDWYRHLAKLWPEKKAEGAELPTPSTVKEMVQADMRRRLRGHFDEFLTDAEGLEPVWLLNEIIEDSLNSGWDLAESFSRNMDGDDMYVRVPWKHFKRMQDFAAFLTKEESD